MDNKNSKYLLTFLTIICFLLMIFSYINASAFTPVRQYAGSLLAPIQSTINRFGQKVSGGLDEYAHLREVYAENEALSVEVQALRDENTRLRADSQELVRLRELFQLDQQYMDYPKVAARVIAKDSGKYFSTFRIDKGLADGIEVDMNVLSGGGLIGIVTDVGSNYSTVRSIIDDESNVYSMCQHSFDTCLVRGDGTLFESGLLKLTNIDKNAKITDGDAIVTSNLSTKYLPGILIGYASNVTVSSQHLTKSGYLVPVADFDNLQEVLVITRVKKDAGIDRTITE